MARRNPRRNLSRLEADDRRGGGWQVRMQRQGQRFTRYFADSTFGGKLAALRQAKAFRDQVELDYPSMDVAERARTPPANNRSGIVGVRLHRQKDRRGDYDYYHWCWVAQWTDGHRRRRTRSFSIQKYGDREAYRLACRARREGVASSGR